MLSKEQPRRVRTTKKKRRKKKKKKRMRKKMKWRMKRKRRRRRRKRRRMQTSRRISWERRALTQGRRMAVIQKQRSLESYKKRLLWMVCVKSQKLKRIPVHKPKRSPFLMRPQRMGRKR